jgi:hypothetical protein
MWLLKRSLAPRTGYFPDFHFGIQDQRTAMSILCWLVRWLQKPSMTRCAVGESRLRRVPRIAGEEESETTPETGNKNDQ